MTTSPYRNIMEVTSVLSLFKRTEENSHFEESVRK